MQLLRPAKGRKGIKRAIYDRGAERENGGESVSMKTLRMRKPSIAGGEGCLEGKK